MTKLIEYYNSLGDMTESQKDDLLKELLFSIANSPVSSQHNFVDKWDVWRNELDYFLCQSTFGRIMKALEEYNRLRFIQDKMVEIKEDLLKEGRAIIKIGDKEYSGDFLFSCLALLKDENV